MDKSILRYGFPIFLLSFLLCACEPAALQSKLPDEEEAAPPKVPELPIRKTLTDTNGRSIEAKIVGRTSEGIEILKLPANSRHVVPLNRLSDEDRNLALSIPVSKSSSPAKNTVSTQKKFKLAKLEDLRKEIEEIDTEIVKLPANSLRHNSLRKQRSRLSNEAFDLEREVKTME